MDKIKDKSLFKLLELIDPKTLKLIKVFIKNKKELCLLDISKLSNVPLATCSRIIFKLINLGILKQKKISRFKVYSYVEGSLKIIEDLFQDDVFESIKETSKNFNGINKVIIYGDYKKMINLFVIGKTNEIEYRREISKISLKFKKAINVLFISDEQFNQMMNLGIYNDKKTTIYEK